MRILLCLFSMFISACSFDYAADGTSKFASMRMGTDTEFRHVQHGGLNMTVMNEKNSDSFRQVTSVAKYFIVADALRGVANTVTDSMTKTKLASEETTKALAAEKTSQLATESAAEVAKAEIAATAAP